MARILAAALILLSGFSRSEGAASASDREREFLRLLASARSTPQERRRAFDALREAGAPPSSEAVREIRRAWEDALREIARRSTSPAISAEGQRRIPLLAAAGERVRRIVSADSLSRERLDEALADAARTIEELRAKVSATPEYREAAERVREVGPYAAWAGAIRGFGDSLGETLIELAFLRNVTAPAHAPILDFDEAMGASIDPEEAEAIGRTNIHRIRLGLRPLEIDLRLVAAARKHSEEMARLAYFGHDSPTPARRTVRLRAGREGVAAAMENIAMAVDAREALSMWIHSAGHHRNMIAEDLASIGVGQCERRWTMVGGRVSILREFRRIKAFAYVRMRYEAGSGPGKILELARWCIGQGLAAQAEDELERAIALDPGRTEARDLLEKLRAATKKA